jgi:hypothetical protein
LAGGLFNSGFWRDVAENSAFIGRLNDWNLPDEIDYYLFFSYQSDDGGDGVVSLDSQIPMNLQTEAKHIFGFNASHAGILHDKKFIKKRNKILQENHSR